jgi:lysophospholipase L1-like esterase
MTARRSKGTGPTRYRLVGWLVIVLSWLLGLAACELLARRLGGFVIVDGQPATVRPHDEYGGVTVETLGGVAIWRRAHPDRPSPRQVKEGFRIVVLGDSVLLPALLDDRYGAVRLLERELNARLDGGPYEVVNLAEGGWNSLQEEQVLLHEGLPLAPDLVLVGVSPNDNQQFAYRGGQLLEVSFLDDLDHRSTDGLLRLFAAHSYLYNLIWLEWKRLEYATGRVGEPQEVPAIVEPLQRMRARSAELGARLGVICLSMLLGDRFDPAIDHCSFQHLVDWASQDGVALLDPIPAYAPYPKRDLRLDQIHLSTLGHRVLARAMFDWLVDLRLVPYRRVLPGAADVGQP